MTVDEAIAFADEWTKGQTFYEGAQGWRVVCAVLAAEVRRLREALQALYDEQNGPPLIRDKADWEAAMAKASKALEESQ